MSGEARVAAVLEALGGAAPVEIAGEGELADALRARLGNRLAGSGRPAAVVVASEDPDAIRAALSAVDDLGLVVLAAPVPEPLALDLYPDVHVRGLTVAGVAAGS